MAKWFNNTENEEEAGKAVEAKFGEVNTKIEELGKKIVTKDDIASSVAAAVKAANEQSRQEEETRKRTEEQRRQQREQQENYDPEKEFETFAGDPRGALNRTAANAARPGMLALARQTRNEVLGSKEYYHGEFKKKVDEMIESGTTDLNTMSNVSYILNCYNLAYAEYAQAGKLDEMKRATSMHGFADGGAGNTKNDNAKPTVKFADAKAEYAAKQMGLTEDDIVTAAKDGAVRGLELVA